MKIFISHPTANRIKRNDEVPVNIEGIESIENSSCLNVDINNVLDFIALKDRDKALVMACSKLRLGGKITMNGVDAFAISNHMNAGLLTMEEFNVSILNGRLSTDSLQVLLEKLEGMNLKISKAQIDGFVYSITAERV